MNADDPVINGLSLSDLGRNAAFALVAATALTAGWWVASDIWHGEWRELQAKVVGMQYVAAYTSTTTVCSSDGRNMNCHPESTYHPPQYHVFTAEDDGNSGDYDDQWAFSHLERGGRCTVRARFGRSGIRYVATIEHR